jgi:hypothetical protein
VFDELRHARIPLGQPAHDSQPVHIGQSPVHDLELAQVIGLVDDRGQRRTDSSGGGTQGDASSPVASTTVYINVR